MRHLSSWRAPAAHLKDGTKTVKSLEFKGEELNMATIHGCRRRLLGGKASIFPGLATATAGIDLD